MSKIISFTIGFITIGLIMVGANAIGDNITDDATLGLLILIFGVLYGVLAINDKKLIWISITIVVVMMFYMEKNNIKINKKTQNNTIEVKNTSTKSINRTIEQEIKPIEKNNIEIKSQQEVKEEIKYKIEQKNEYKETKEVIKDDFEQLKSSLEKEFQEFQK
jgi:ABC-type bacteriocin/lantibiotic exporter with double-glycine peptidase domain